MPVRFRLLIVLSILLAVVQCSAQDKPIAEISGAYQYDHLSLSASSASATLNLSRGWDGSVNVPILRWLDVVGDVSRVSKSYTCSGCGASATVSVLTYGGGPQLNYRNSRYVQPFARIILGSAHSSLAPPVTTLPLTAI